MATPLPTIATNTEETAFAVLKGNVILDKVNVAIFDMSKKMTSSIGHLTAAFISFTKDLKKQQAQMLNDAALSAPSTVKPKKKTAPSGSNDSGNFIDNVNEHGVRKAVGLSIVSSIASIFTNMTSWLTGIVATFGKIGKSILRFARFGTKLFLPLTIIIGAIGAISASWESFANGDIWGGLEKAVTGFFNSVVTIPLDLIKDGVAWLLKKMGFDEAADVLDSFSFTEEFNKIIGKIFGGVKEAFKVITDLFSFGEEDKTALGLLGKLTDIIFAPINMAIGYIRGVFGWTEEEGAAPFKLQDWIWGKIDEAIEWVKGLFSWAGGKIAEGWTNLTNYVSGKWEDIKTWVTGKLEWATGTIGAGWTNLTNYVSGKWEDIKTWVTDKLTWATGTIGAGWTNLTNYVSDKWEDIKTWVTGKLEWATGTIGAGWTSLTDFVSGKWEDIKTWVTGKLTWATGAIGAGWTSLTDFVSGKWEDIKTWVTDKLTWATDTIGAGWTSLTDFVSGKWEDIKTWVTGKLEWATGAIGAGWTNLTDFVSGKWEDIKTLFTGKLEWATGAIGAGWTSLTDFVSGKWEDIKTWFGEKLTMATDTVGAGANFISQLVTDAWGSVKQWFTDALSGITDALPSWDDITTGIISRLPSWMVPDSFKTPGMIALEIKERMAENQALVDQIDSGKGGNSWNTRDWVERRQALEEITADQAKLADLEAARVKRMGDTNIVTTNNNNNSSTGAGGGITYPITIREGQPIGGRSAYLATGRYGF